MQSDGVDGKPQAERLDHSHGWVALLRVLITESMVTYREVFIAFTSQHNLSSLPPSRSCLA